MDFITSYHDATEAFVAFVDAPRSLIHVHVGMAIYLGCQFLMGTRRGSLVAVSVTVALAVFHELMNRLFYGSWRIEDTSADLLLSLFWPTMCYAVSIFRRWSWKQRVRRREDEQLRYLRDYQPDLRGQVSR